MKLKMNDEKIVGYILIAIGIAMIFFSVYEMVRVFTGASPSSKFVQVFGHFHSDVRTS